MLGDFRLFGCCDEFIIGCVDYFVYCIFGNCLNGCFWILDVEKVIVNFFGIVRINLLLYFEINVDNVFVMGKYLIVCV